MHEDGGGTTNDAEVHVPARAVVGDEVVVDLLLLESGVSGFAVR